MTAMIDEMPATRYFGPARVVCYDDTREFVSVEANELLERQPRWARMSVYPRPQLTSGDCVLVAGEDVESMYVIGVLSSTAYPPQPELGQRADLDIERDHAAGVTRVRLPSGDLEFVAQQGNISFESAGEVRLSGNLVKITGRTGIHLALCNSIRGVISFLYLLPRKLICNSEQMTVIGSRAKLSVDETECEGKRHRSRVDELKVECATLQVSTTTLIERAKNAFRNIKGLAQLRLGRSKTVVDGSYQVDAADVRMKSGDGFKVNAERIHLG